MLHLKYALSILSLFCLMLMACSAAEKPQTALSPSSIPTDTSKKIKTMDTATFGAGCFWCVEAVFLQVKGVHSVTSGYTGGKISNPTYKEVCSGLTGHAEAVQIQFDSSVISFKDLLEIFWQTHDPTTLNRQGADEGTQYRSVIYYHSEEQKKIAEMYKKALDESGAFSKPIVTEISAFDHKFYKAEDYHQNYYNLNSSQSYCAYVIKPKLDKFKKVFQEKYGK